MPIDVDALLLNPQCNDPRVDAAWREYQSYAFEHPPLRFLKQCGRCDSEAIAVHWAGDVEAGDGEVAVICREKDCGLGVILPIDRAYWMWKLFVRPQNPMLGWKIENSRIVYFKQAREALHESVRCRLA